MSMIPGSIPDAQSTGHKLKFVLPFAQLNQFSACFKHLEDEGLEFSLQQTSLEDAFLNFTKQQSKRPNESDPDGNRRVDLNRMDANPVMTESDLFWLQFKAMLLKRWYSFQKDWRMWLIMLLPSLLIFTFLAVGFSNEYVSTPLKLSSQILGNSGLKSSKEMSQGEIADALYNLTSIQKLKNYQQLFDANATDGPGKYLKNIRENPSMENVLSNLWQLGTDESEIEEVKEI